MKLISSRVIQQEWYVGKQITCKHCKAVMELEKEDDMLFIHKGYQDKQLHSIEFKCLDCGEVVKFNRYSLITT